MPPSHRIAGVAGRDPRPVLVNDGTLNRFPSPKPAGALRSEVASWDLERKLVTAAKRAGPKLPAEMREQFESLFTPLNIGITAGVLVAWATSQFFGVGEVVDVGLMVVGVAFLGLSSFRAGYDIGNFLRIAATAESESDLDRAATDPAEAVSIIGVTAFLGLLFKAGAKIGEGFRPRPGGAPGFEGNLEPPPGEPGPWWKASDFGEDFPGTRVPKGFRLEVAGREYRVTANACEHMAERMQARVKTSTGGEGSWPRSPWRSEVDYPLSSLAGALEQATPDLLKKLPGRNFFIQGNWELGVDTADNPWAVYHARPLEQ
jgi:hypothetical protein